MIAIGSDHAGYEYKVLLTELLSTLHLPYKDFGTASKQSTDYPDWGFAVAQAVSKGECELGILMCGTGIGMSIVANKVQGVRAAACESPTAARLARQHNNANVLCLGSRIIGWELAVDIVKAFLSTTFESGGRHEQRVNKIHSLTQR
ncbi:MAG: ribose 5-phosphate isomerase B [Ignavibacteriales bacterium]|nr:ribose 5-phosphate isomerase B [Ignavibacteriales bacterium]